MTNEPMDDVLKALRDELAAVSPSPEFQARVRQRIAAESWICFARNSPPSRRRRNSRCACGRGLRRRRPRARHRGGAFPTGE